MIQLTAIQKEEIIKKYLEDTKVTCLGLSREYSIGSYRIYKLLKDNNIKIRNKVSGKKRMYELNENFFEQINTEEKAYFLGLLYSDGYVDKKRNLVGITLQEQDMELLEKLRNILNYNKPLKFKIPKQPNRKNLYILDMYSKKIHQDVIKLGCLQAKSLILEFPTKKQVPPHLLRHFIRGYFDGDGSINREISIVSTNNFLLKLDKILSNLSIEHKYYDMECNDITKVICIFKRKSVLKFCEWIYSGATIFMKRKYDKYLKLID